jgi:hypothetical protein
MKRLALFFAIAGLFALAACDLNFTGPIGHSCSAQNCPPPGSCQVPNEEGLFDGIPVCTSPSGSAMSSSVAALPGRLE